MREKKLKMYQKKVPFAIKKVILFEYYLGGYFFLRFSKCFGARTN